MQRQSIRVLVADDDASLREALADLIGAEAGFELVGVASDAVGAAELAGRLRPDVALVDVRMPGGGGVPAVREICARSPLTRVIGLSAYGDRGAVVGMLAAGAVGYLVKGVLGEELLATVRRAAAGESTLSAEVATPVVTELADQLQRQEREIRVWQRKVAQIQLALVPGRLRVVFQPVVDLGDGRLVGAEALSRFDLEPQRPPNLWFEDAAEVGLAVELELYAAAEALRLLDLLPGGMFLAVNLSPATIVAAGFGRLFHAGVPVERIVVEITEHAAVEDYDLLALSLQDLRARGLRLAVDDAGAGYSSLQHILRLDPDIIKLDISLTRHVDTDARRRALAAALIPFAAAISAVVVAEGIETGEELATLRALGATLGQGYYLGRPGPLPLTAEWVYTEGVRS